MDLKFRCFPKITCVNTGSVIPIHTDIWALLKSFKNGLTAIICHIYIIVTLPR